MEEGIGAPARAMATKRCIHLAEGRLPERGSCSRAQESAEVLGSGATQEGPQPVADNLYDVWREAIQGHQGTFSKLDGEACGH